MRSLFILDLSWTNIKELPSSLSDMESLKALILAFCGALEYVPYLGKLKNLRELDLTYTGIRELPQGMEELVSLEFLSLEGTFNFSKMIPKGLLLNFRCLQWLYLPYRMQLAPVEEIVELKHLEKFHGRVADEFDFNWLIRSRPNMLYGIKVGSGANSTFPGFQAIWNELELLQYNFDASMTAFVFLAQDIQHLGLENCKGLSNCLVKDFQRLNNPRSIECLHIVDCQEIECLTAMEQSLDTGAPTSASSSVPSPLPHGFFSSLTNLWITRCHQMKKLGPLASELQNLVKLEIECCDMIEEILEVNGDIGGGELGEASVVSLPKLECLRLEMLPRLKSICNATMVCSSIWVVRLRGCQTLQKLPLVFGKTNYDSPPSTLQCIMVGKNDKEWWEKLELGHTSHHSLLKPFVGFH